SNSTTPGGNVNSCEGVVASPPGTIMNANLWRVENCQLDGNGYVDRTTFDSGYGTGLRVHGSDSNGGVAIGCYSLNNWIGFDDGALGGSTFVGCYAEGTGTGFTSDSAGAGTFV